MLRLTADAQATDPTLGLTALRGISNGSILSFFHKNGTAVMNGATPLTATVANYNAQIMPPTITPTVPIGVALASTDVYVITNTLTDNGPTFWARSPGSWSGQIAVIVTPSRRRAVSLAAPATSTDTEIRVASTAGFYQGAIIEIDIGTQQFYPIVASVGAGGILVLTAALGVAVTTAATVRIVEIDINIVDPSLAVPISESHTQLTWNPDPNPIVRLRHYSTVINARSQLVYVQPPGVAGANGSEVATLTAQPTTFNGWQFSISSGTAAIFGALGSAVTTEINTAQTGLVDRGTTLEAATNTMAEGALPANNAATVPVRAAATALTTAATTAAGLTAGTNLAPGSPGAALTAALSNAVTAANAAVTAANDTVTAAEAATTAAQLAADRTTVRTKVAAIQTAIDGGVVVQPGADGTETIDYVGTDNGPGQRSGIQSLKDAENISIIAAPGQTLQVVQNELTSQCELLRYRFAVLDGEQNPAGGSVNAILAHRNNYDTSYARLLRPVASDHTG